MTKDESTQKRITDADEEAFQEELFEKENAILKEWKKGENEINKNDSTELTDADKNSLQEFLEALDDLAKREPKQPQEAVLDDRDFTWNSWNTERDQLIKKYHEIIGKALVCAIKREDMVIPIRPESIPLKDFLLRFLDDPFEKIVSERSIKTAKNLFTESWTPMLTGELVSDLMQMNIRQAKIDQFTRKAIIEFENGRKITVKDFDKLLRSLSTPAKKLINTAIMYLTDVNYFRGHNITPTVEIPLIKYGEACGYQLTPRIFDDPNEQEKENKVVKNRIKEFRKEITNNLRDIKDGLQWTAEITKGKNKGDYADMTIISSHRIVNGIITINFDIDAAKFLVNSYVMQHPNALLKVDNRNPNAYALGVKIAQHNSNDNNAAIGTNNTLSVESLLSAAPEIQSIDELQARGQRDWKNKIKKPLENSLDELTKVRALARWEYRDPTTQNIYDPETAQALTWTQYSRLMVEFILVDEPDQAERRKRKTDEKIAAMANKEKKSAENTQKKRGRPRKNKKSGGGD